MFLVVLSPPTAHVDQINTSLKFTQIFTLFDHVSRFSVTILGGGEGLYISLLNSKDPRVGALYLGI